MAPRSYIWQFFAKQSKDVAECCICFKKLKTSGNTSNLANHLKQKHNDLYIDDNNNSDPKNKKRKIINDLHEKTSSSKVSTARKENAIEIINNEKTTRSSTATSVLNINNTNKDDSITINQQENDSKPPMRQPTITKIVKGVTSYSGSIMLIITFVDIVTTRSVTTQPGVVFAGFFYSTTIKHRGL
ncbi:hypothetical protein ABEB36_010702 [Hypothenemus hampei]|uniref:BED-type domain-containing protein n=1 Tax=Hypothenemus hampei TaxID=57062 RepID=A0ABD1ECV9_HYPHA